jgi:CheY-like chemotaxis protein
MGTLILYIEDDPGVARAVARRLRLEGYEVMTAATREEALQHVEIHGGRLDLILTDFHLPGMTGDEIVAEIAMRLQFKPPMILLTASAGPNLDKAKSIADRFLTKPVDMDVLLQEIKCLLARRP